MTATARKRRAAGAADNQVRNDHVLAVNRRALHDYTIGERYEAGIALQGTEIKSIRAGGANIGQGFVRLANGEAWLEGVHIAPYEQGSYLNHDPTRPRRLLLHRSELRELAVQTRSAGFTIILLRLYLKRGRAKVQIGVARGKRQYEKREAIAAREAQREIGRAIRAGSGRR